MRRLLAIAIVIGCCGIGQAVALPDESDRAAFRAWFTFLADAEFERTSPDVVDCASLVRHAYREALRVHSPEWYRRNQPPISVAFPDVGHVPRPSRSGWPLFRVARDPDRFAEFADASTIASLNARRLGRDVGAARAGDLLYFHQTDATSPDHLMVFVGASPFDRSRTDWVVYHTGPDAESSGEVRKVSLADLSRHPSPRWRPTSANPSFVGVLRLSALDAER